MNNKINELVLYYEKNKEQIKKNWNETETRIELINPFFECLGWDVNNTQKLADPFKEVKHEASLKIGSNVKAPDYSFNYGKKIFYLEAKKPSVDIKHDIHPAYQLRRYGWTAKLPISILTDFEELSIYDCRVKPDKKDNAGIARVKFYTINDYINKWDEIYNFISKEAILHGSLNEFENKQIKGTASIDDDFLNFIEDIRKLLALDIAKKNPNLSENDFNFAIQMIIDRIIFIRICEDRGIENYESLKNAVSKDNCYTNLIDLFQKADIKYNSGLFHFKKEPGREETPDLITGKLKIDDRVLKEIINGLYYPDCPFALDVIESDVLGSVYERFLGKVITLSESHKAKIDYKPEVRKAGGVYYTPHYIVEYIVNNTVGELIKNKTPDQINKIKILDPACGSGSFLVEAYQYLLNYHLNYYHNNDPEKWKKGKEPKIFESQTGLHLTLMERKRILLNNIFGVDIDKNAVEVTKLSLLLKVLEYEGLEVQQKLLFDERVLPDLYKNIKCGNSLIGSDFYNDKDLSLFGEDEMKKVNAFDWDKEFPDIFNNGGFDCIIGNPPYVVLDSENSGLNYFKDKYNVSRGGKINLYKLFIEKGLNILNKSGYLGYICPSNYLSSSDSIELRKIILEKTKIIEIIEYTEKDKVFNGVTQALTTIIVNKGKTQNNIFQLITSKHGKSKINQDDFYLNKNLNFIPQNKIIKKIKEQKKVFSDIFEGFQGEINVSLNKEMFIKNKLDNYLPLVRGNLVSNYLIISEPNEYCPIKIDKREHYKIKRVVFQEVSNQQQKRRIRATLLNENNLCGHTTNYCFSKNNDFNNNIILGLLNSSIVNYYFSYFNNTNHVPIGEVKNIPIPDNIPKQSHDHLVSLVDQMLDIQKKYHSVKTDHEKKIYKNQIDNIDKQIDTLVYELYGLTEDEIKIVEGKDK